VAKPNRKPEKRKSSKSKVPARGGPKRQLKTGARTATAPAEKSAGRAAIRKPDASARKRRPAPAPQAAEGAAVSAGKKSPLTKAELEHFRELLLAKRREILGDMRSWESEALQRDGSQNLSNLPIHMADQGTDNYEQEFTLGLMEKDRQLLKEIDAALVKIRDGVYGICEGTGQPISKPRLEAQPWARYSIEYARKLEQGRIRP